MIVTSHQPVYVPGWIWPNGKSWARQPEDLLWRSFPDGGGEECGGGERARPEMRRLFDDAAGARVLAFGAHPDDIEFGAGGLVARLAARGADVVMAVVSVPSHREERLAEAAEGAHTLGARLAVLFRQESCRVEDLKMHQLVARFDGLIAEIKPDLVLTHDQNDLHYDHRLVNQATVAAVRRTPCDLLMFLSSPVMNAHNGGVGQCFADISDTIETKLDAIRAHKTQLPKLDVESFREVARAMGRICGTQYAETFEVSRLRV